MNSKLVHSSITAARAFYALRRAGIIAPTAYRASVEFECYQSMPLEHLIAMVRGGA